MCLLANEGRAPARTARPPLRLPRPPAARRQVAGEGAAGARRGPGAGGRREGRAAGLWPSERGEGAGCGHFSDSFLLRSKEGRKRRKEARKEGLSRWKVQAEAPSPCGCSGRRAAPGAAGRSAVRGHGWGRFACVFVCASAGPGKGHVCLGCALWGAGSAPLCLFPEVGGTLARSGNVP